MAWEATERLCIDGARFATDFGANPELPTATGGLGSDPTRPGVDDIVGDVDTADALRAVNNRLLCWGYANGLAPTISTTNISVNTGACLLAGHLHVNGSATLLSFSGAASGAYAVYVTHAAVGGVYAASLAKVLLTTYRAAEATTYVDTVLLCSVAWDGATTLSALVDLRDERTLTTRHGTPEADWKVGPGTDVDIYVYAANADATQPNLRYLASTSTWQVSHDGATWYNLPGLGTATQLAKLGPPSTGTWPAVAWAIDSCGARFYTAAGGSPGTWVQEGWGFLAAAPVAGDFNSGAIFAGYYYHDTTAHMTVYHDGSAFVETATPAASTTVVQSSKVAGDAYSRFTRDAAGLESWGSGSGAVDTTFGRDKAGSLRVGAGYQLNADNQLRFDEAVLIDHLVGILASPANLRALWIFNAVTGTTITDRSPVGGTTAHPVTLSSDAANWAPTVYSKARALTQTGSLYWDTPDAADLTFVEPNPFSVMCLVNPSEVGSRVFLGKGDLTTGATQQEWKLYSAASKLYFDCFDDSVAGCYIGRNNAATTLTAGVWQTLCATKGVGATSADIKLYESGVRTDDTNHAAGVYVAMEDKAAKVGSYTLNAAGAVANQFRGSYGLAMVVAEELTQAQILRMDRLLRGMAGIVF